MDTKKIVILLSLFVLLIVLVIVFIQSGKEETAKPKGISGPDLQSEKSGESRETRTISIFFPSETDALLHPEEREILVSSSVLDEVTQAVEELIKGSMTEFISPFPPETKLRSLYLTDDGVAYVDFSKDIDNPEFYGTEAEILTIYSVVNTLAYNFQPIKKVFILVDGGQMETLGGHVDLSRAFPPRFSLNTK